MKKEEQNFIICYDTGIDYEFDPENPNYDNPKDYDYVSVTAETMREALEKSADEIQKETGQNYPIDFADTMKSNITGTFPTLDWEDIIAYINENSIDVDLPAIWETLAKDENIAVRQRVAEYPDTPTAILEALAKDEASVVRFAVACNKNTPAVTLEILAKDETWNVRKAVAENENTPAATLEALAKDGVWNVRWSVADNKNTPAAALEALAKDENASVRITVVRNKNTLTETLETLAKDESSRIRMEVTRHPNALEPKIRTTDIDKISEIIHSAVEKFQKKYPIEEYEYPELLTDLVADFENRAPQMIKDCLSESGDTALEDILIYMHDLTALDAVRDIKHGEYFPIKLLGGDPHIQEAAQSVKLVISASDLKEAKAEKDIRDAAAPKQEQQRQKSQEHEMA